MIVEEAAEVLEAHIVTSLTKSVEHVIFIGKHLLYNAHFAWLGNIQT